MFSALAKRRREEDEVFDFGGHGNKKFRLDQLTPLPPTEHNHAVSPTFQFIPRFISPSLTPNDSSDDESGKANDSSNSFLHWREEKTPLQNRRPPTLTLDTAMDIEMADSQPFSNSDNLSPWPASARSRGAGSVQPSPIPYHLLNQSLNISGGRTATPIHDHFTLNMRPEQMLGRIRNLGTPITAAKSSGPQTEEETDWWRRRRLPSPISEVGDVSVERISQVESENKDHSNETIFQDTLIWPTSPPSMDIDGQETPRQWLTIPERSLEGIALMNGTAQPVSPTASQKPEPILRCNTASSKSKASFSMGYRADCEKCRLKVPGHYSHIVRS